MDGKEIFCIWAPVGKKWVDWVRPVPFVEMQEYSKIYSFSNFTIPPVDVTDKAYEQAAVFVDLPGADSVAMGLALAKEGFRPIPIYNGTIEQAGARATVDNQTVGTALLHGASMLREMELSDDALPAFLLDRNRLGRFKMEIALFDNSWDIYPQDIPSADYFLDNGICNIIIVGDSVARDLKKILYEYQKKKINIYLAKEYETPKKVVLHKPFGKDRD